MVNGSNFCVDHEIFLVIVMTGWDYSLGVSKHFLAPKTRAERKAKLNIVHG